MVLHSIKMTVILCTNLSVGSEGENLNAFNLYAKMSHFPGQKMFIGLTKRMWYWEGGDQIQYYNWQDKGSDIFSKKCLSMFSKDGTWSTVDCQQEMPAFCRGEYTPFTLKADTPDDGTQGRLVALVVVVVICLLVIAVLVILQLKRKLHMPQICQKRNRHSTGNDPISSEVREKETPLLQSKTSIEDEGRSMKQQPPESSEKKDETPLLHGVTSIENEDNKKKQQQPESLQEKDETPLLHGAKSIEDEDEKKKQQQPESSQEKDKETGKESEIIEDRIELEPCGKWPSPITTADEGATVRIRLTIKEIDVTRPSNIEPDNLKFLEKVIKSSSLHLILCVTKPNDETVIYEYKKDLPKLIVPNVFSIEYSSGAMFLILKKRHIEIPWKDLDTYNSLTTDTR